MKDLIKNTVKPLHSEQTCYNSGHLSGADIKFVVFLKGVSFSKYDT